MKLRQFEFARRDYEGLSSDVADKVRQRRADYAEGLRNLRNTYRRDQGVISQMFRDPSNTNIITRGGIRRGGIKSNYKVNTSRNLGLNHHNGEILKQQINIAKDAGDLIRKEAVEERMN